MAIFGLQFKNRRKSAIGGFHADYIDKKNHRSTSKPIGLVRTLASALSLIFGGFACYIALHYIPAYMGLNKIMSAPSLNHSRPDPLGKNSLPIISDYLNPFRIRRAYIRAGQSASVDYSIPAEAQLHVTITRCRPAFIIEIFQCEAIEQSTAILEDKTFGSHHFRFKYSGFYLFGESVEQRGNESQPYKVTWSRR